MSAGSDVGERVEHAQDLFYYKACIGFYSILAVISTFFEALKAPHDAAHINVVALYLLCLMSLSARKLVSVSISLG